MSCAPFTPDFAALSRRFALGSRLSFFLYQEKRDGLRYLAFLFRRVEIAIRAFSRCWRGYRARLERRAGLRGDALSVAAFVLRFASVLAALLTRLPRFTPVFFPLSGKKRRLAIGSVSIPPGRDRLRAFSRCRCGYRVQPERRAGLRGDALSVAAFVLRFASVLAALLTRFASVHACLFSFVRKKETACGILRSCSARSRSPFVRSRGVGVVICLCWFTSGLAVYLWRSRRGYGETWNGGARLAARCLCAFARAHWPCRSFRGEYAGAARPRLRQRVFDSLDSLQGLVE